MVTGQCFIIIFTAETCHSHYVVNLNCSLYLSLFGRILYLVKNMSKPFAHVDIVERDGEALEHLADTEQENN